MASDSDYRVLLTGANGFIGQVVVPLLLAQGAEVLALTTDPKRVKDRWGLESVDVVTETEALVRESIMTFHPSVLVHLAWSGLPDYSPTACLANVESSARVIRTALESGVSRFLGAGSCWEYGDRTGRLDESMATTPTKMFAQAKSCIRQLLETMAVETGTEARWARVFYAYGSGQRNTSLIPMTIRAWQEGAAPELRDTESAIDLIHVDDVASGLVALALQDGPSGTFNLGSGHATRVADVVEVVRTFVSGEELASIPTSCTDSRASWADISKMQDAFGWQPAVALPDGVRLMLDTGTKP